MHLKKLEIQGFKSFAEKTTLEFMPGITTVIGPNGSGKSNISDAIRWVLGEQSIKSLRGGKMEDVIFTGTSARKPLNFAEVTLTIDNSDNKLPLEFVEVSITRRVYRTGESEFLINRTPCRLKDITELFMDTGIGRDGYSVIGQGRIDEILSNNSVERRNVFEEAAGISKYKARRDEAEKKLNSTQQNLLRITDIITELESQLGPMKKQSEKALTFLNLREELKIFEINNFISSTSKIEENLAELNSYIDTLNEELDAKNKSYENIFTRKNALKSQSDNLSVLIDEVKTSIFAQKTNIEKITSEIAIKEEKAQSNFTRIESLNVEIEELNKNISALTEEKKEKLKKISLFSSQKEDYVKILNEKEAELNTLISSLSSEEQKIEDIKSKIIENMNLVSDKKSALSTSTAMLTNADARESGLKNESSSLLLEKDKINIQIEDIKERMFDIQSYIKEKISFVNEVNTKKQKISSDISNIKNDIFSLRSDLNLKESRHKFLLDTEKENEGYFKSVKSILCECDINSSFKKGIHGSLAQLITVPENLEAAIETALGANLQNIVTDTQNDAKKAITYLKQNHLGRATFLPISEIKFFEPSLPENILSYTGVVGMAPKLINFDLNYSAIINSLLGKTVIVESLDNAIALSKNLKGSFKIVSLDGDIVNTGGSMSGGSQKIKIDNLLSRKRNISSLEEEINDIKKEIAAKEKSCTKLSLSFDEENKNFEVINSEIKEKEIVLATEKEKLSSLDSQLFVIADKLKYNEIEKNQLLEQRSILSEEIKIAQEEIAALFESIASDQSKVDEYKQKNKTKMEARDNLALDITDYKISISSFDESVSSVNEIIERIENDISSSTQNSEKKLLFKDRLLSEIEEIKKDIELTGNKIKELNQTIDENENNLTALSEKRADIEKSLSELDASVSKGQALIDEVKEKMSKAEIKKAKLDMDFDNINTKMWEDYQMSYADALKLKQDIGKMNVNSKINSLKSQIKDLGSINIDAIEEYKTLSTRFEFMSSQKEDLDISEEKLKKIISDMTATMKEEFIKKFNIINKNFDEVFSELFGGGKAQVKLADESNILESGIDIEAQPPGKKLQNMSLLSGGERAFTAIALLFAILKINPSPFCLLDEIEAALDDVNVYRFADYVKKFSDNIQFIIITHRKGTMESADSIYGVTMEEKGVSKLVSMKLE